jgi:hypothetical protein
MLPWFQRFIFIIFIAKGGGKINLWNQGTFMSAVFTKFIQLATLAEIPKEFFT